MSIKPIIYENETKDVFIIDGPTSIAFAQGHSRASNCRGARLTSCPPQQEPFIGTEPKTVAAAARVSNHLEDDIIHKTYARLIRNALAEIKRDYNGVRFCHERAIDPSDLVPRRKSSAVESDADLDSTALDTFEGPYAAEELSVLLHELSDKDSRSSLYERLPTLPPGWERRAHKGPIHAHNELPFFVNEMEQTAILYTMEDNQRQRYEFSIPADSAFLLAKCEYGQDIRAGARQFASETHGRFNFILLDPPWPNKSAKRKFSYVPSRDTRSLKSLLLNMDIDSHILPGGNVAVWVTNKAACRSMLLGPGGLFETWNVSLVEEWIWVKVTSGGKPITAVEGWWRKPYEVLLIAQAPANRLDIAKSTEPVKRRVLVGVPDLHSRKPCLKQLVEDILLLDGTSNYYAMEIFARHLVAGWFSVGNEVLQYNWHGEWDD